MRFTTRKLHYCTPTSVIRCSSLILLTIFVHTAYAEHTEQTTQHQYNTDSHQTLHTYQHVYPPHQEEFNLNIMDPSSIFGAPMGGYARATRSRLAALPLRLVGGAASFDVSTNQGTNNDESQDHETLSSSSAPHFPYRDGDGRQFICRIYDEDDLHVESVTASMFDAAVLTDEEFIFPGKEEENAMRENEFIREIEKAMGKGNPADFTGVIDAKFAIVDSDGNQIMPPGVVMPGVGNGRANIPQSNQIPHQGKQSGSVGSRSSSSSSHSSSSSSSAPPPEKEPTMIYRKDILKSLSQLEGMCAQLHNGYWSYEWCHESTVVQFHVKYNSVNVNNVLNDFNSNQETQLKAEVEALTIIGKWRGQKDRKVLVKEAPGSKTTDYAPARSAKSKKTTSTTSVDDEITEQDRIWKKQHDDRARRDAARKKSLMDAKRRRDEYARRTGTEFKDDPDTNDNAYTVNMDKTGSDKHSTPVKKKSKKGSTSPSAQRKQKSSMQVVDNFDYGEYCEEADIFRSMKVNIRCCDESEVNPKGTHNNKIRPYSTDAKTPMAVFLDVKEDEVCKYTATICTNVLCANAFQSVDQSTDQIEDYVKGSASSMEDTNDAIIESMEMKINDIVIEGFEHLDMNDLDLPPNPSLQDIADAAASKFQAESAIKRRDLIHGKKEPEKKHVFKRDDPVEYILDTTLKHKCIEYHDDGWWTYSFCYKQKVQQYHEEKMIDASTGTIRTEIETTYELGTYNEETSGLTVFKKEMGDLLYKKSELEQDILTDIEKNGIEGKDSFKKTEASSLESHKPYYTQEYTGGNICDDSDVTDYTHMKEGVERSVSVRFFCGSQLALTRINEDSTCHYVVDVTVPELCIHKDFVTPQAHTQVVKCLPVPL